MTIYISFRGGLSPCLLANLPVSIPVCARLLLVYLSVLVCLANVLSACTYLCVSDCKSLCFSVSVAFFMLTCLSVCLPV